VIKYDRRKTGAEFTKKSIKPGFITLAIPRSLSKEYSRPMKKNRKIMAELSKNLTQSMILSGKHKGEDVREL
jgi:hypothetical protein